MNNKGGNIMKLLSTKEIKSIRDKIKKGTLECDFDDLVKLKDETKQIIKTHLGI